MKNDIETSFNSRFSLLNSQEDPEVIIWTCSSSSDCENVDKNNVSHNYILGKRKRKSRKKSLRNISNLDIKITDPTEHAKIERDIIKSPILKSKSARKICKANNSRVNIVDKNSTSPIIRNRSQISRSKSPIIVLKSKLNSPNVCKKLFDCKEEVIVKGKKRCLSPILNTKPSFIELKSEHLDTSDENQSNSRLHDKELSKTNLEMVEKVKSYFNSNFSSDSTSQNSISEYDTPKSISKTSDEIEISDLTQGLPMPVKLEQSSPLTPEHKETRKKIKYKKDGLAYRLNVLLKKQNANISLWQHEHFLAANSNFVMPKGIYTTYRIKNVDNKFGCFLLLAINDKNEEFLILINSCFVKNKIESNVILKLYEPYKILDFNNGCNLIVNVCKFECFSI